MVKFKVLKEEVGSNGKSRWSGYATTPDANIEDISISTQALTNVVAIGTSPQVQLFGVKGKDGRVCNISGSFKGVANNHPPSGSWGFDVVSFEDFLVRGAAIQAMGNGLPELADAYWTINDITWDRSGNQGGLYKFRLQLGYVWNHDGELMLYDEDTGTNIPTSAKFFVIQESTPSSRFYIYNTKVVGSVHDLNRATFNTDSDILDEGDKIKIYCESNPTKSVFYGIVKKKNNGSNTAILYDCAEIGTLLYRKACAKTGGGIFKPRIRIPNPYKEQQLKLKQIVGTILKFYNDNPIDGYSPGYGTDKTYKWGDSEWLPGREDEAYLPPQILSGFTVGKALDNVLNEQCGLHTWFDNNTGKLEYGFYRNLVTIDPSTDYITYTEQIESLAEEYAADGVILMDNSANNPTRYPVGLGSGSTIQYKFSSDLTNEQLYSIARRIYNDIRVNRDTFKVKFPAGTIKFTEGDVFTGLGDKTVTPEMPYRGGADEDPASDPSDAVWQIKEIIITDTYTECIVGSSYYSVFDIYRTALQRYDGCPAPTESKDIETDEYVVSARSENTTEE